MRFCPGSLPITGSASAPLTSTGLRISSGTPASGACASRPREPNDLPSGEAAAGRDRRRADEPAPVPLCHRCLRCACLIRYSAPPRARRRVCTTSKSSSGRQEFDANSRMIRPSWPTTAVVSVWVTSPASLARRRRRRSAATSSICAGGAGRKRPMVEAVGALQHRFAVSPEDGGRVERGIEGHAEQRQRGRRCLASSARRLTRFEVPDHQRAEVRQRAARIDEGHDQDAAGEVPHRHGTAVLIAQLEGWHDYARKALGPRPAIAPRRRCRPR